LKIKNLTTLLLTLLVSGGLWAEGEFPIELTCEVGDGMFYINVGKVPEETWVEALTIKAKDRADGVWWLAKTHVGKKTFARKALFKLDSNHLSFEIASSFTGTVQFDINRFTGKIRVNNYFEGECFKGFKEYKERKF